MLLVHNGQPLPLLIEPSAHAGVRRVAGKVAEDIRKVTGVLPQVIDSPNAPRLILCATLGCSPVLDQLTEAGRLPQAEDIRGKWECYAVARLENPFPGVEEALIILGSDKRGTEFGMFTLSEYIGVSPLVYFGDAAPLFNDEIDLGDDLLTVSKEPSVRYRGLFINDEWPCFGTGLACCYACFRRRKREGHPRDPEAGRSA